MKKITFATILSLFALAVIVMPGFAKADNSIVSILGASNVTYNDARISVLYNSDSDTVDYGNLPTLTVQYQNLTTGDFFSTGVMHEYSNSRTEVFDLQDLQPSTTYSYRVIMTKGADVTTTVPQKFTTPNRNGVYATQSSATTTTTTQTPVVSTNTTSTTTSTASTSSTSNSNLSLQSVAKKVTPSKLEANIVDNVATGGVTHANGIVLYISNEHARVYQDDSMTFTVKAQNTHSYSINDATVVVTLPDQYEFSSSKADADYDSRDNTVTYSFGRIAAQATETFTFTADAVGEGKGTVYTKATLTYDGGNLSASDHDAYASGAKSVLGASVFGAGFFPQTFGGWFLILLLIVLLIIGARRYIKAPKPAAAPAPAK